jgi:hypothetical protein
MISDALCILRALLCPVTLKKKHNRIASKEILFLESQYANIHNYHGDKENRPWLGIYKTLTVKDPVTQFFYGFI